MRGILVGLTVLALGFGAVSAGGQLAPGDLLIASMDPGVLGGHLLRLDLSSGAVRTLVGGLPEDLRGEQAIAGLGSFEEMAKQFMGLTHKIGNNVAVPTDSSSAEVIAEFRKRIGVPEKADGYTMPTEGMPAGFQLDDAFVSKFKTEAHRLGISAKQFAGVARWMATTAHGVQTAQIEADKQRRLEAEQTLRKAFGDAYLGQNRRDALTEPATSKTCYPRSEDD